MSGKKFPSIPRPAANAATSGHTDTQLCGSGTLSIGGNSDTVVAITLAGGNITGTAGVLTGSSTGPANRMACPIAA